MSLQIQGNGGVVAEVETAHRAIRMTQRPIDVGALGSYSKAMTSGTIAAALGAGSLVFGMRWAPTPNTLLALIRRVNISIGCVTGFTAGFVAINMFAARSYTVLETSGGTAGTFTGNNAKRCTAFATTAGMACYISTTAAISGGTATLDTDPMATVSHSVLNTGGAPVLNPTDIFRATASEHPLVLANSEGFVLKATVPATGTWQIGVTVDWDEITAANFANGS